ncbi:MAG: Hsp33 family molecular chaperone HslO [Saccharofermentans sp.]|nr:Hsp33 family molecular chaperone HslO [Saccharofermentans sp.]
MIENPYYVPGAPEDTTRDHIVIAEGLGGLVKCIAINTSAATSELCRIHETTSAASAALGRFITGSLLISESMKRPTDKQTTVLRGNGPLGGITCVTDFGFKVRAYPVENNIPTEYYRPGKINVSAAVGEGTLTVIRDIGLKEPYVGSTELISGEIAEDFTYYLAKSEQTPSIVSLGVLIEKGEVTHSGGLMIQLLPGAGDSEIDYLEARAKDFPEISFLLAEGFTPAKILDLFMGDPDLRYLSGAPVSFECTCSKERMSEGLAALGRKDLEELVRDEKGITTQCHFCNKSYHFEPAEIAELLAQS